MGRHQDHRRHLTLLRLVVLLLVAAVGWWGLAAAPAGAKTGCDTGGGVICKGKKRTPGPTPGPPRAPQPGDTYQDTYETPACSINHAPPNDPGVLCMGAVSTCPRQGDMRMRVYTRLMRYDGSNWQPQGNWEPAGTRCMGPRQQPQVTPALVLVEVKRAGLPAGRVEVNPANARTLVAFPTIFYTERGPYATTLTVVGQAVQIRALPTSYTWHWGDGASETTKDPGAPWPTGHLSHVYDTADTFAVSVDVTYHIRWNAGAGWQDIAQPLTITTGPSTPVTAVEKVDLLKDG